MSKFQEININEIKPNQYQPRSLFDQQSIDELATSIEENGLLQPITVRETFTGYELIAGERRYRACKQLNMEKISAIVIEAGEVKTAILALIENIQREDLSAIEEANGYLQMIRLTGLTQNELAQKVGKTQSTIANKIRLLNLNEEVQQAISSKQITERHGRALLSLNEEEQKEALNKIKEKDLNVAQTEAFVETHYQKPQKKKGTNKCFGISTKLIIKSFKDAYKQAKELKEDINMTEQEDDENYIITITIKK